MASDPSHRTSSINGSQSTSVVPAVTNSGPQVKATATTRSAFARFVTQPFTSYASRPTAVTSTRADAVKSVSSTQKGGINSIASAAQDTSIAFGLEIAAIGINQERTHAVLAGRDILRTIRVAGKDCTEELDLRSAPFNRDGHFAARPRDNFDLRDIKWSHGQFKSFVAGAASNGKIILYDLARGGQEIARLHEHTRQVHSVAFHPTSGHLLLSGSQDGSVKLWDLRDTRSEVVTCRSRARYQGGSEGVRDVKWSPQGGWDFAFGTDNGTVQKWDYRSSATSKLRIVAHDKRCTAIDWHPDGRHLISASQDQTIKVWDFSSDVRRQKPGWVLRAPYPIMMARWRPPCWTSTPQNKGTWQSTQIVTSYEKQYPIVHVWDFRRPYIPFRALMEWPSAPTGLLWHSQDLLWSVSKEGIFYQTDVQYACKVLDRRPLQALAVSPTGEICVFTQKRPPQRPTPFESNDHEYLGQKGPSPPNPGEVSRGSFDDSIDESFLSSSYRPQHVRTASGSGKASSKSVPNTPPAAGQSQTLAAKFNETMLKHKEIVGPRQIAFHGQLDGVGNPLHFSYLAQKLKVDPLASMSKMEAVLRLRLLFEQNAGYYERAGSYRQAQTWRLMSILVWTEMSRRAQFAHQTTFCAKANEDELANKNDKKYESDVEWSKKYQEHGAEEPTDWAKVGVAPDSDAERDEERQLSLRKSPLKSAKQRDALQIHAFDSTSNVPTPVAKPVQTSPKAPISQEEQLPEPSADDQLELPPSLVDPSKFKGFTITGTSGPIPQTASIKGVGQQLASAYERSTWLGTASTLDDRKAELLTWRAAPRAPLILDSPNQSNQSMRNNGYELKVTSKSTAINAPPPLDRHNSNESFSMFSASSNSQGNSSSRAESLTSRDDGSGFLQNIPEYQDQSRFHQTWDQSSGRNDNRDLLRSQQDRNQSYGGLQFNDDSISLGEHDGPSRGSGDRSQATSNLDNIDSLAQTTVRYHERSDELSPRRETAEKATANDMVVVDHNVEGRHPRSLYPFLDEIYKPLVHRKLTTDDLQRLIDQAKDLMYSSEDDEELLEFLVSLATHFFDWTPDGSSSSALSLTELHEQLQRYYTDNCPDPQMSESLSRMLAITLGHEMTLMTPEFETAVWLTYFDTLHRHLQHVSANQLVRGAGMRKAEAVDWPPCTTAVNCSRCDKPANNGTCSNCDQRLGLCAYCWERTSPYPWPPSVKKSRQAELFVRTEDRGDPFAMPPATLTQGPLAMGLYTFCLACNHGIHAGCREQRRKEVNLAFRDQCPIPGCMCICFPSKKSELNSETVVEAEVIAGEGERIAKESKAVKGAGRILESGGGGGGPVGGAGFKRVEFAIKEEPVVVEDSRGRGR